MSSTLDDVEALVSRGRVEDVVKYAQDNGISKELLLEMVERVRQRTLERERRVADLEDERQKLEQDREEAATNARFAESQETRRDEVTNPSGYECNDGRFVWVQTDPCPVTSRLYKSRMINGRTERLGVEVLVEQRGLSSSEMCELLQANSAKKISGANSTYERNKLRDANGC